MTSLSFYKNAVPWNHYPHFTQEETEALKAEANCPKAMSRGRQWTSVVFVIFSFFLSFFTAPQGMQDLSFLTRYQTHALCSGSSGS